MHKVVVITGSSRGIGFGLAERFLEAGCAVMLNGSTAAFTASAFDLLLQYGAMVAGHAADASLPGGVELLCDAAERQFDRIDIWINNAGIVHRQVPAWQLGREGVDRVLALNIGGVVHGTIIPFRRMRERGSGLILNMEGIGSNGFMLDGMAVYGTSKSALTYFTRSFAREVGDSPVRVGTMSPGMVVTDMLLQSVAGDSEESARRRKFFNVMADRVDEVTSYLCREVLETQERSPRIVWLTKRGMLSRVLLAPFRRRDLFS
jgi:NAD(P)-dependent dehydrogenase (short-subunit alcohol dehydrogenase family)